MTDPHVTRRKRLHFRSWHRGTKEADLLVGSFADAYLDAMTSAELDEFERVLEIEDGHLVAWVTGRAEPPHSFDGPVFRRLLEHRYKR
jgi:antitoxin CptB